MQDDMARRGVFSIASFGTHCGSVRIDYSSNLQMPRRDDRGQACKRFQVFTLLRRRLAVSKMSPKLRLTRAKSRTVQRKPDNDVSGGESSTWTRNRAPSPS